jgi:hypothetical protein
MEAGKCFNSTHVLRNAEAGVKWDLIMDCLFVCETCQTSCKYGHHYHHHQRFMSVLLVDPKKDQKLVGTVRASTVPKVMKVKLPWDL